MVCWWATHGYGFDRLGSRSRSPTRTPPGGVLVGLPPPKKLNCSHMRCLDPQGKGVWSMLCRLESFGSFRDLLGSFSGILGPFEFFRNICRIFRDRFQNFRNHLDSFQDHLIYILRYTKTETRLGRPTIIQKSFQTIHDIPVSILYAPEPFVSTPNILNVSLNSRYIFQSPPEHFWYPSTNIFFILVI